MKLLHMGTIIAYGDLFLHMGKIMKWKPLKH